MAERIVLRHLSGSKANQVEEFPISHIRELVLGRDLSSTVKYDPERDDLVGRQHARIAPDAADPTQFILTDLNSRNGTFVNKQRIYTPTRIAPGDIVQLGPGGPEFQFDLEPRPAAVKPTRMATDPTAATIQTAPNPPMPPTRAVGIVGAPSMNNAPSFSAIPPTATVPTNTGAVGKATVERMISQNVAEAKKSQGRKFLVIGSAAFIAVLLLFGAIAGYLFYRNYKAETQLGKVQSETAAAAANAPMTPTAIAKANRNAVVKIEAAWRLISPDGGLVYHEYVGTVKDDRGKPLKSSATGFAKYVLLPDGTIEPKLSYKESPFNKPIGYALTGSGFVVSSDGFILTNRHVASAWRTSYEFPEDAQLGVVYNPDDTLAFKDGKPIFINLKETPINWVPIETKQEGFRGLTGRNDVLEVTFPGVASRNVAQLERWSDTHDVAMIKINVPENVPKVEINDNYNTIQPGDDAIVLGYPSISPRIYGIFKSQDVFNRGTQVKEVPDPTLSVGNIGRLIRGREGTGKDIYSIFGDAYQLTINSTGAGNSGGPVLDNKGRVIGIFYAGARGDASITFAVPIRYGKELMSVSSGK